MHFIWIAYANHKTQFGISIANERFSAKLWCVWFTRWSCQFNKNNTDHCTVDHSAGDYLNAKHKDRLRTFFIWVSFAETHGCLEMFTQNAKKKEKLVCVFVFGILKFTWISKLYRKNPVKLSTPRMHVMLPSCSGIPVSLSNAKSLWEYAIKYQIIPKNVQPPNVAIKYEGKTKRHGVSILGESTKMFVIATPYANHVYGNTHNCGENIGNVSLWFVRYFLQVDVFLTTFFNHTTLHVHNLPRDQIIHKIWIWTNFCLQNFTNTKLVRIPKLNVIIADIVISFVGCRFVCIYFYFYFAEAVRFCLSTFIFITQIVFSWRCSCDSSQSELFARLKCVMSCYLRSKQSYRQ